MRLSIPRFKHTVHASRSGALPAAPRAVQISYRAHAPLSWPLTLPRPSDANAHKNQEALSWRQITDTLSKSHKGKKRTEKGKSDHFEW